MTPRQSKPPQALQNETATGPISSAGPPLHASGVQDHNFHTQAIFNIHGQVAKLETGLESVQTRLEKVEVKLDEVKLDIHGAKKIAWAFGVILSIVGAFGLVLLNKILDVVVVHYKQ